jgi:dTDP-4-dehydrorhamnose reductase
MRILITGANGQLGKELNTCFSKSTLEIICLDKDHLDITKISKVKDFVENFMPDWVINCAAYTNVDLAEKNISTSNNVNGIGPENLASICKTYKSKLLHISTDSVFSSISPKYFDRDDKTNPINQYSMSKVLGEKLSTDKFAEGTWIIRTSWLYGDYGGNFINTVMNKIANREHINVVDDQFGQPTFSRNLANFIKTFIFQPPKPGIYHYTDLGYVSRYDLARQIYIILGIDLTSITKVGTKVHEGVAVRPKFSLLASSQLPFSNLENLTWQESLQYFLKSIKK